MAFVLSIQTESDLISFKWEGKGTRGGEERLWCPHRSSLPLPAAPAAAAGGCRAVVPAGRSRTRGHSSPRLAGRAFLGRTKSCSTLPLPVAVSPK